MFKNKAFLISLALVSSNLLLPNQVRSGLEVDEEITSETQEVNFKIERRSGGFYEGYLMLNNQPVMGIPYCDGEILDEFINSCIDRFSHGHDDYGSTIIMSSMNELLFNLREEEEDLEIDEEITSETQEVNFKIERRSGGFYEGYLMLNNQPVMGIPYCDGEILDEFINSCIDRFSHGHDDYGSTIIMSSMNELLFNLREEEEDLEIDEEVVETTEAEDIDFDSITVESLPYSVDCPPKNKDLKIKQNKKEKFVVRFAKGKKFYKGLDFDEAVDVFEETYEDKCVE